MADSLKYGLPIALLLLVALAVLSAWYPVLPVRDIQERRSLQPFPEVRLDFLDPLPRDFEAWYEDHWPWRSPFVRLASWLTYRGVGRSPRPDKVVIGKEGWLFKGGTSLEVTRGKMRFTQRELRLLQRELENRRDSVAAHGGRYYLAFAPLKGRIYPEYLPDHVHRLNAENATDQLLAHLREHSSIDVIDLHEPLYHVAHSAEAGDTLLYYRTDHHWTPAGALYASRAILRRLHRDFSAIDTLRRTDYSFTLSKWDGMGLAQLIGMEDRFLEQAPRRHDRYPPDARRIPRSDYVPPTKFPFPEDFVWDYRTERTHLPSLFVNRESFANDMAPYLSEHFSRSFYYFDDWNHNFNGPVYYREGGDIYLQLVWESMVGNLLGADRPAEYRWE